MLKTILLQSISRGELCWPVCEVPHLVKVNMPQAVMALARSMSAAAAEMPPSPPLFVVIGRRLP